MGLLGRPLLESLWFCVETELNASDQQTSAFTDVGKIPNDQLIKCILISSTCLLLILLIHMEAVRVYLVFQRTEHVVMALQIKSGLSESLDFV